MEAASVDGPICVADSQSSSQVGDISRFKGMALISATEREVRVSLRDNDDGLTVIAERLRVLADAKSVMVKLGQDGVLVHTDSGDGRVTTDQLPALNTSPVDVAEPATLCSSPPAWRWHQALARGPRLPLEP